MLVGNNYMLYIVMQILHLLPPPQFWKYCEDNNSNGTNYFLYKIFSYYFLYYWFKLQVFQIA